MSARKPLLAVVVVTVFAAGCPTEPEDETELYMGAHDSGVKDAGVVDNAVLRSPFDGDFSVTNVFDHDLPLGFSDTNGKQLTFWGESFSFTDGHNGYDWVMPVGTPLYAALEAKVVFAGTETPFFCPPLSTTTAGQVVSLEAKVGGTTLRIDYVHLSQIDVKVNDVVTRGSRLGLSGNTGCSTGPHLHFSVYVYRGTKLVVVDPYGWNNGVDPWVADGGAQSVPRWAPDAGPALFRESALAPNPQPTDNAPVAITRIRWIGVDDAAQPNNEFIELTRDGRFASGDVSLAQGVIRNKAGDTFTIPAGVIVSAQKPTIRIYSGKGTSTDMTLFMNRDTPFWSNSGDCARLSSTASSYSLWLGNVTCP